MPKFLLSENVVFYIEIEQNNSSGILIGFYKKKIILSNMILNLFIKKNCINICS